MIENMRKYTGLMVVVLALLAVGLILTMGNFNTSGGKAVTKVNGRLIDQIEYRQLGASSLQVIKDSPDPVLTNFALETLHSKILDPMSQEDYSAFLLFKRTGLSDYDCYTFATQRLVARDLAASYGIYPSTEAAKAHTQTVFATDGKFDQPTYNKFIESIGNTGFEEKDYIALVAEALAFDKLRRTIVGGLETPKELANKLAEINLQTIDLSYIKLKAEDFSKDINPTDEEIRIYWERNKAKYLTNRQMRISYTLLEPNIATPKPVAPQKAATMTEDEFAEIKAAYDKELAQWEIEVAKPAIREIERTLRQITEEIDTNGPASFLEAIKRHKLAIVETPLFDIDSAPEALKPLNVEENGPLIATLLRQKVNANTPYTTPWKLTNNARFIAHFDEVIEPKTKSFEQAKNLTKQDLIKSIGHQKMLTHADELKEKFTKEIAAGKTFDALASAEGLSIEMQPRLNIALINQLGDPFFGKLYAAAELTNPGTFSKENVKTDDHGACLLFVNSRTLDAQQAAMGKARQVSHQQLIDQSKLFSTIFRDAIANAGIPTPN